MFLPGGAWRLLVAGGLVAFGTIGFIEREMAGIAVQAFLPAPSFDMAGRGLFVLASDHRKRQAASNDEVKKGKAPFVIISTGHLQPAGFILYTPAP
jgi:hypothetical protein